MSSKKLIHLQNSLNNNCTLDSVDKLKFTSTNNYYGMSKKQRMSQIIQHGTKTKQYVYSPTIDILPTIKNRLL